MYLLDTNVFIEAKNRYYGFDVCPGFWNWVEKKHEEGIVFSIAEVKDELAAGADELSDWAKTLPSSFFLDEDAAVLRSMGELTRWASSQGPFTPAARAEFLSVADYPLVAHGHARSATVVTHEGNSVSAKRIKIPNACEPFNVPWMLPFQMLKDEKARFDLR